MTRRRKRPHTAKNKKPVETKRELDTNKLKPKKEVINVSAKDTHDYSSYKLSSPIKYSILFYDNFDLVLLDEKNIQETCHSCDQLNIVVSQEGDMDRQEILSLNSKIKLFAGKAWTLVHTRRKDDGWYSQPR